MHPKSLSSKIDRNKGIVNVSVSPIIFTLRRALYDVATNINLHTLHNSEVAGLLYFTIVGFNSAYNTRYNFYACLVSMNIINLQ